jgi:hypothetical protein
LRGDCSSPTRRARRELSPGGVECSGNRTPTALTGPRTPDRDAPGRFPLEEMRRGMTMSNGTPATFHDPRLQAAIDEVGADIQGLAAGLDRISEDIRRLESLLQRAQIPFAVEHRFETGSLEPTEPLFSMENYGGEATRTDEFVSWARVEPSGRWRLMYRREKLTFTLQIVEGMLLEEPVPIGEPETEEHRPIIETPVQIRLRAHRALADLVRTIAAESKVGPIIDAESGLTD